MFNMNVKISAARAKVGYIERAPCLLEFPTPQLFLLYMIIIVDSSLILFTKCLKIYFISKLPTSYGVPYLKLKSYKFHYKNQYMEVYMYVQYMIFDKNLHKEISRNYIIFFW